MTTASKTKWRNITTPEDAFPLIDNGVIMSFAQAKSLSSRLDKQTKYRVLEYLADRFCENSKMRLYDEILIENIFLLLHHDTDTEVWAHFLEYFIMHQDRVESSLRLLDISLNMEFANQENAKDIQATLISVLCELGLGLDDFSKVFPEKMSHPLKLREQFSTYLLSASNTDDEKSRLTLLYYFSSVEGHHPLKPSLNKLLKRYGYSLLDNLFILLFDRKTESTALQYLLDNLVYFFSGDEEVQAMLHQILKSHFLKNPDRFGTFLSNFLAHYHNQEPSLQKLAEGNLLHQLGALYRVANEVNHRGMGYAIVESFLSFENNPQLSHVLKALRRQRDLRPHFEQLVKMMQKGVKPSSILSYAGRSLPQKMGRPSSFHKIQKRSLRDQVSVLSNHIRLLAG